MSDAPKLHREDATNFILVSLQGGRAKELAQHGYDLWLPSLVAQYVSGLQLSDPHEDKFNGPSAVAASGVFLDAAWDLCRRGILRLSHTTTQPYSGYSGTGHGYSITTAGRAWLKQHPANYYDSNRLGELFLALKKFGGGFEQRSVEAARCYQFGQYLACCALCGAAAESILLAVAVAKSRDEATTLATYRSASGRKKVTDSVVSNIRASTAEQFRIATGLLSYWRDEAAHGTASNISEIEAHDALARLLRFAQFASDNWSELTA